MNPKHTKAPPSVEPGFNPEGCDLTLGTGGLYHRLSGSTSRVKQWTPMMGTLLPPSYVATRRLGKVWLFALTLVRPSWLDHARSFQDVRSLFNPFRWRSNECLNGLGWHFPVEHTTKQRHVLAWSLVPISSCGRGACRITAEEAVQAIDQAELAFREADYCAAFEAAHMALRTCPRADEAHLILGTCIFRIKVEADVELKLAVALHLEGLEQRLRKNVSILGRLWEAEDQQDVWESASVFRDQYRQSLQEHEDVFRHAREFLLQSAI